MLSFRNRTIMVLALAILLIPNLGVAAEKDGINLDYPELMITPRASKRLQMEAAAENQHQWTQNIPIQVSALSTLAAGLVLNQENHPGFSNDQNNQAKSASSVAVVIGGGWLAASVLMNLNYQPYQTEWRQISTTPNGSKSEQLVRERLSEEAIHQTARLGRRLTWLSAFSNLAASTFVMASSGDSGTKSLAGLAALAAFTPVIFNYHWSDVECEQESYRKRIYGPVVSSALFATPDHHFAPALLASLEF